MPAPSRDRLELLYVTLFPASPARYGAQRRIQGILESLSHRHHVTAISLLAPDVDGAEARAAMEAYCENVVLVPSRDHYGTAKRFWQARSMLSTRSYERLFYSLPELRDTVESTLASRRFDVSVIEAPYLAKLPLWRAPTGQPAPRRVLDQHNIEFDLVRQMAAAAQTLERRVYNTVNWPKVRREEMVAWRDFDGVTFTSGADEARARALVPSIRSEVVPNAVDVRFFRPSPAMPPPDGRTVLFFGAIDYFPNTDGIQFFLREIWPTVAERHPDARLKIVGLRPPPDILARRGPRIEVTGVVDDLRPHLSQAEVIIAPLRVGGGTRFKILEALSMAKPIVSTRIGAEGIDVVHGESILLADDPGEFAACIGRLLDDPSLGLALGAKGRALVEERYSWDAATARLEAFFRALVRGRG
jgi:polysaccharide biosynthesis protein PslH